MNLKHLLMAFTVLIFISNSIHADILLNEDNWQFTQEGVNVVEKDKQPAFHFTRGKATYKGVKFQDGIIEFDMYSAAGRSFVYVYFRENSDQGSEVVYLRTHKSNAPDTIQYAPVYQGRSAWQLYHGKKGTATGYLPANTWQHVKLHISGNELTVWIGDDPNPVMDKVRLARPSTIGTITFRGNIPPVCQAKYSAYIRNIQITPALIESLGSQAEQPADDTMLRTFLVSPAFESKKTPFFKLPDPIANQSWQPVSANTDGLVELLRWRKIPAGVRSWAAAADVMLTSPTSQTCTIKLGFSDAITLKLNGHPIVHADASYRYSENRQEGLLHGEQLTVFLPLQAGENKLRMIIADSFGGWGLKANLIDCPMVVQSLSSSQTID